MKIKKIFYLLTLVILYDCSQNEIESNKDESNPISYEILQSENVDMIVLGPQLTNPYSVENMTKAYESLKSSNLKGGSTEIKTTHYYVRFLPEDYLQLDYLEKDTTLILFDYPLDRKIMKKGSYYHDSGIPEDKVTWQYTVVPANHVFNEVKYEILAELYLKNDKLKMKSSNISDFSYEEIEMKSLELTGNTEDLSDRSLKSSFFPSGRITVYDHVIGGQIGVPFAKVRMKNWFNIVETYTSGNGYFTSYNSFPNVDYSIKWETTDYDIRSGTWGQAYTNGPDESTSAWYLNISSGNNDYCYATVQRAADRYHYGSIGGLNRPSTSSKLKYCVYDTDGTGVNWGNWDFTGIFPDILIYCKTGTNWQASNTIFSTTIHETAHSTHISLLYAREIQLAFIDVIIRESWANAVEWYITQKEYISRGVSDYDIPGASYVQDHMQLWSKNSNKDYTPLFIDLVDDYNQSVQRYYGDKCPYGGTFDGQYCFIGNAPSGETPFIYNNKLYYTPVGCCNCPDLGAGYDGANCYIMDIPNNLFGKISNNNIYLSAVGSSNYPYDEISGYNLSSIEGMLNGIFGLSSLETKLKTNKPSGMTDKQIDLFLNLFYNL
jgi:hypothetical protein